MENSQNKITPTIVKIRDVEYGNLNLKGLKQKLRQKQSSYTMSAILLICNLSHKNFIKKGETTYIEQIRRRRYKLRTGLAESRPDPLSTYFDLVQVSLSIKLYTKRVRVEQNRCCIIKLTIFFTQTCKDLDVKAIMDTWIKQKGYPVVYIDEKKLQARDGSKKLVARQRRFLRDIPQGTKQYDDEAKG